MSEKTLVDDILQQRRQLGLQICQEMSTALEKIGFNSSELNSLPEFDQAEFSLVQDPYTQDDNLTGYWYDQHKHKIGNIQFLSDGSFYAEYDVIKPHPTKNDWFVEAINAWGKSGLIKTEAKLLPAL